ncbi:peptide-N(4)-(N-acetyl-beta-glucosaminyl)asparagine amidase-like [Anopheles albimanus]|uniref:peptide-N(4)-(N-acetyl-beta- glucosaminyl)asparagine amidase-like n=1 Tax=Anopheles albimanus TaxID=7167 RepID=UPI0016404F6D|nr:peptide-N(4)-(N-acetyl-beta-glucosaminyl)asparagine amidase-like [Anopheles albimanus]
MAALNQALVLALETNNPRESYLVATETLLRLLDNIIREPQNAKYRTVRLENPSIKEKLLSVVGMKQLMLAIGFIEANGTLTVPPNVLLASLRKYREFIHERKELVKNPPKPSAGIDKDASVKAPAPASTATATAAAVNSKTNGTGTTDIDMASFVPSATSSGEDSRPAADSVTTPAPATPVIKASRPFLARIEFPRVLPPGNSLLQQLELLSDQVMQYEDDLLQASGRSLIPLERLRARAKEKQAQWRRLLQQGAAAQGANATEQEPSAEDLLVEELTAWFRGEFFRWVNAMPCTVCGNEKTQLVQSTVEDGVRVEVYRCCGQLRRFYRYNDVEKLLHTRRGRCGEWANCFTFLCRCLGYEARYVFSTGDHVWTEVWSERRQRWIHVDPCENVLDAPLMYEHGWRKEITFVFAFAHDDVQDVSWRYSNDHTSLVQRRRAVCRESTLLDAVWKLRGKRRAKLSADRVAALRRRTFDECLELLACGQRVPTPGELEGRSSGSLEWRLQRGEQQVNTRYMFIPTADEVQAKQFNIRYCCATDRYERFLKGSSNRVNERITETSHGWESRQYMSRNIFRKEEHDWQMVYLARTEGTEEATIEWYFDFSVQGLRVKQIELRFGQETYESAKVELYFIKADGSRSEALSSLCECGKFTLQARLSGGSSWQHAQLFRQSKASTDECPFEMNVILM